MASQFTQAARVVCDYLGLHRLSETEGLPDDQVSKHQSDEERLMMKRVLEFIPKLIMPWGSTGALTFFLTIILVAQVFAVAIPRDAEIVWKGNCSFKKWNDRNDLGLIVDCGDKVVATITHDPLIRSYLMNPGPISCTRSALNNVRCDPRPALAESP
jgi:hypothetical protein